MTRTSRLLHPVFLASVALLLVNDHVLKAAAPGAVTGKLSDLAGLVVLPVLICVLAGVTTRRASWAVHGLVGAAFAAMQFVPAGRWLDALSRIAEARLHHTADPSDLVALAVLPLGVWIVCDAPRSRPGAAWLRVPALGAALVAVLGTSMPYVPPLMADVPLVEATSSEEAFARMEAALRASGLEVRHQTWGPPIYVNADSALVRRAQARWDSAAAVRTAEGRRVYEVDLRQPVVPSDTLALGLRIYTRWTAPHLVAETISARSTWLTSGRRAPSDDEVRAIIEARILAPLRRAGVSTPSSGQTR